MTTCHIAVVAVLVAASSIPSPAQEQLPPDAVIARAGDVYVSEGEFLERYEMLPGFGRHRASHIEAEKLELLYSIIAEKLLAQDATAGGLDSSSGVRQGLREVTKLLARDKLYKREIIGKVSVSQEELKRGLAASQIQLSLRYLFFAAEEDAQFVRKQLRRYDDFATLRIDTSFHALRDTATVIWGEADADIERAAYGLKRGEISRVIKAGSGYYIITVTAVQRCFSYASLTPEALHDRVATALQRRKEHARLEQFEAEVLRDKVGYAVPRSLRLLASALASVYGEAVKDSVVYLTPARASAIERICGPSLGDTIAVAGSRLWSIGDVIARLTGQGFGVLRKALPSIPIRLNAELMGLVQRELMAQEALRRGLDTVPDVRRQVGMWRDAYCAGAERAAIRRNTPVSEADVWSYLKWEDSSVIVPQVQVRELRTRTFEEMEGALDDLQRGERLPDVVKKWSSDAKARENGGLSSYFPITGRPPIGELASNMNVGERYGPVSDAGGVLFFELVGKKSAPLQRDTSMIARLAKAREEVTERKGRRAVTLRVAAAAKEKGIDIYYDRLKMLKVTSIAMMTYRILGFGGRMLAVPFVVPELDWLGVDRSKGNITP